MLMFMIIKLKKNIYIILLIYIFAEKSLNFKLNYIMRT